MRMFFLIMARRLPRIAHARAKSKRIRMLFFNNGSQIPQITADFYTAGFAKIHPDGYW